MHGHTHQTKHKKNTGSKKELQYKQPGEEYATINCDKGDARFEVTIYANNQVVMAKARGSIIKGPGRERLQKGDLILLQQDSSSSDKYYIIHKYSQDDVKRLRKAGELAQVRESGQDDEVSVVFENDVIVQKQDETVIDADFIANI